MHSLQCGCTHRLYECDTGETVLASNLSAPLSLPDGRLVHRSSIQRGNIRANHRENPTDESNPRNRARATRDPSADVLESRKANGDIRGGTVAPFEPAQRTNLKPRTTLVEDHREPVAREHHPPANVLGLVFPFPLPCRPCEVLLELLDELKLCCSVREGLVVVGGGHEVEDGVGVEAGGTRSDAALERWERTD